jgi:hypothetical protein
VFAAYGVPDDEINKITHENACRLYQFDPFVHIPKDQATVGALRKATAGHDVSIRALSHKEKKDSDYGGLNAIQVAAAANSGAK